MTKEMLLVKRFLSLTGQTPIPKFKEELAEKVYLLSFELPKVVKVQYVKEILEDFEYFLEDGDKEVFYKLTGIDRYLHILDCCQEARDYCKKFFKKKEGSDPLHH